ncbi:glycine n-methyltransferase [Holotrichia oblita]|uniref:Glycine n-methyltransferase n=1 Tax=Holotrichia oblita TaxID=644536 RepID=A0ACB9TAR6_HOLOL|nr:glycine n-methyltransferase [Holotrichia oblita]
MADTVFRSRSLGAAAEGVKDQYADGKAAKVWEIFIGDKNSRTQNYKNFLVGLLRSKGCKRILDVACGTGIDSVLLLEEGFEVVSADASDKMLKYALKKRWSRRKEPAFDNWGKVSFQIVHFGLLCLKLILVIEEANWLTLYEDIEQHIGDGFDAVICLGNSFAHMMDIYGDQREQRLAIKNFEKCVKPGGLLLIDHRNYDYIIATGSTPSKCLYYNSKHMTDIKTSVLFECGKPAMVMMDYLINVSDLLKKDSYNEEEISEFRLSYYPHRLETFKSMLMKAFEMRCNYKLYGDFKPLAEVENPNFYIHLVEKL